MDWNWLCCAADGQGDKTVTGLFELKLFDFKLPLGIPTHEQTRCIMPS